jgi:hypothetical protein
MSAIQTLEGEWDRLVIEFKKLFEKAVLIVPPGATGATGPTGVTPPAAPKA